ncbi:MAG: sugar phosphate isomerase/epimerase [Thermomicrobiales bacterium]
MILGLDTFSLRWQDWTAEQMLDYAASIGLQNVHFSERGYLTSLDPDYLRGLKDHADRLGLRIELGMRSFDQYSSTFDPALGTAEQQLADMIAAAQIVGSPIVRCFLGMQSDRIGPTPFCTHVAEAERVLKAVAPIAETANITIAVENHGFGDFHARELRALIERVGSAHVGVCLDTGNPVYGGEDAVFAAEILAPYVVTCHLRDTRAWATADGCAVQWVTCGDGDVDLARVVEILKPHAPDIALDLEIITGIGPREIDFLHADSEFWRCYPDLLARDFARFLALLPNGHAGPLDQLQLPDGVWQPTDEEWERYRAQQREHLERSVRWCRDHLNLEG